MTRNLKMTVLIDNLAGETLGCEWGLSILIEADGKKILLDTGASGLFAQNAQRLNINLSEVDIGVLSHAHYDHADGMEVFFSYNDHAMFLLREGCDENCFGVKEGVLRYNGICRGVLARHADRIHFVRGVYRIAEGIWLLPHRMGDYTAIARRNELYVLDKEGYVPDNFAHEQSLVIETEKGLVVFNSCSHAGVENILEDVRVMLGRRDVCAYVGGLHLYKLTDEELSVLSGTLQASGIHRILTGHCTGSHACDFLKSRLGDQIEQISAGFSCTFD